MHAPLATLAAWEARLNALDPSVMEFGLERITQVKQQLFAEIVLPPVVLIGGTNGKGSTVALAKACLEAAGYRVGAYTSPHLLRLNERIVIADEAIADEDFVAALNAVAVAQSVVGGVHLSYFELITLAAVWHFARQAVDIALLEVGLGGRLDAVNAFDPLASVVTYIGLDHQAWLGDTRELIGAEKAGIFRAGKPAIYADEAPVASVLEHAQAIGADLIAYQAGGRYPPTQAMYCVPSTIAWAVYALLDALAEPFLVSSEARKQGFQQAHLAGRFQQPDPSFPVWVDVAHNPDAAAWLVKQMLQQPITQWVAVFACYADKHASALVQQLDDCVVEWFCCQLDSPRAAAVDTLASVVMQQTGKQAVVATTVESGLQQALQRVQNQPALPSQPSTQRLGVIVFGSFETVAAAIRQLQSAGNANNNAS